ncbi:hypothetical protein [Bradyrhizobium australiense]|uniref:hypothetical protein n=1 Tax=Bradyrhizobium australiense TaxID=2721161 RepID=UPI00289FA61C|nr:hypothetical protein [Bradyrhizobium australiense]
MASYRLSRRTTAPALPTPAAEPRPFVGPPCSFLLPKGRRLLTLEDAASYTIKLPQAEDAAREWQAAMEALILVAENGGPTMLARIGVMRALNRHVEQVFDPERKSHHWGKRKLKRPMTVFVHVNTHKQSTSTSTSSRM